MKKTARPRDVARALPVLAGLAVPPDLALDRDAHDDGAFVDQVDAIVRGVVHDLGPAEVHVIKIDSWFGQRWLGFSHKILGALGVKDTTDLRVPPFVPARVVSQRDYVRGHGGLHVSYPSAPPLHIHQSSEDNQRRRVSALYPSAALFWWSGATRRNGRGSLMAYLPQPDTHAAWYAELARASDGAWIVSTTAGISAADLRRHAFARNRLG